MPYQYRSIKEESEDEIKRRQLAKIKEHINYAYNNSPYYKKLFDKIKIKPYNISNYDDLRKIPPTTKQDLRDYNPDFQAAPKSKWIDMSSTSGTTGVPVYMPFTRNDLEQMALFGAQTLSLSGITSEDIVHLVMPMSAWLWMAGFGFYFCFTALGACVLRFGPGSSEKSLATMKNVGATAIMGVPSFLVKLGMEKKKMGIDLQIKRVFTIGENMLEKDLSRNAFSKKIEELWDARLFSCYGGTEGPFLTVECDRFNGQHINPYEAYFEILDPETHKPVEDGEEGLITITPLGYEGFPLIRYINGDMSFLVPGRCPCKKMLQRTGPIFARIDHMMKIKGVMIYPEVIKKIIMEFGEIGLFQVEAYTENFMDMVRVHIPERENVEKSREITMRLKEKIRRTLGVTLDVETMDSEELQRKILPPDKRKPVVFIDSRKR